MVFGQKSQFFWSQRGVFILLGVDFPSWGREYLGLWGKICSRQALKSSRLAGKGTIQMRYFSKKCGTAYARNRKYAVNMRQIFVNMR